MASLHPASICWLINCSDTCREHIGLWLNAATEIHEELETTEAALPSDYINYMAVILQLRVSGKCRADLTCTGTGHNCSD